MNGIGGDQTLTPEYPGISDAADMTSWDPPFPVDLKRVRPKDEDYWDQYRAAPKAIISLADGQRLWGSRYGKVSSLRLLGHRADRCAGDRSGRRRIHRAPRSRRGGCRRARHHRLRRVLPLLQLLPRRLGAAARLPVLRRRPRAADHRGRPAGGDRLLARRHPTQLRPRRRGARRHRRGRSARSPAVGYGALIMYGLRTWWVGAVGTTELALHVAPEWLAIGVGRRVRSPGLARPLARRSRDEPAIGALAAERRCRHAPSRASTIATKVVGGRAARSLARPCSARAVDRRDRSDRRLLRRRRRVARRRPVRGVDPACAGRRSSSTLGRGLPAMFALGIRHTSVRPARSVLSLALIAFACFVLVSVGAFRKDVTAATSDRALGHRRLRADGRIGRAADARSQHAATGAMDSASRAAIRSCRARRITRFRLRPGDETSCLTLYRPTNPRIIAPEPRFLDEPRFSFASSMAATPEEIAQSVAAAEPHVRRWRDSGDRRSNDADVRAASRRRRRLHVHARRSRATSACASSARWPTACCNRS